MAVKDKILDGQCFLGIEFGSTRIKAVLIDDEYKTVAIGGHKWENKLEDGYWTYSLEDIHSGLKACYRDLKNEVLKNYGVRLTAFRSMGISGMMHGYMPFDEEGKLLVPFRTWRNTSTQEAAEELTSLFGFNIPQRWSAAHLYQAVLNKEPHIERISYITTLAVYVHFLLTGVMAAGVGEASGMFPVNGIGYDEEMLNKFSKALNDRDVSIDVRSILPKVMKSGESCGTLTEEGALFLDPEGDLKAGIPFCPPEGDAGTGMVATDSVREKTGNVSAGTSVFAMAVLEKPLSKVYPEIDIVATPDGKNVAMVHCNNCCSELDAWVGVFKEFGQLMDMELNDSELYEKLYHNALKGNTDCGGTVAYNFLSGEPVAGVKNGRPMYFRNPEGHFDLANFIRAELMGALGALKMGMDLLFKQENTELTEIAAHGGLFKVQGAADQLLADGLNVPVTLMETAGEGGAWGMAVLAAYQADGQGRNLADFLSEKVFDKVERRTVKPDEEGIAGFEKFMENYRKGLENYA